MLGEAKTLKNKWDGAVCNSEATWGSEAWGSEGWRIDGLVARWLGGWIHNLSFRE